MVPDALALGPWTGSGAELGQLTVLAASASYSRLVQVMRFKEDSRGLDRR